MKKLKPFLFITAVFIACVLVGFAFAEIILRIAQ